MESTLRYVAWVHPITESIIVQHPVRPGIQDSGTYPGATFLPIVGDACLAAMGRVRASEWTELGNYWRCVVS